MKDVVFLKQDKREDRLWENSPHLAFVFWIFFGIVVMAATLFLLAYAIVKIHMPEALMWICLIIEPIIFGVVIPVYRNEYCNISKSIGFVKRDNMLYAIKLTYTDDPIVTVINASSGSLAQAATLKHNFEVAGEVQSAEIEIRLRRTKEETYISALDELLKQFAVKPKKYYYKKERGQVKFSCLFNVKGVIGFLILEEPRIEKETKDYLWISYKDRYGGRTTIKFRNAYGKLKEEMQISIK